MCILELMLLGMLKWVWLWVWPTRRRRTLMGVGVGPMEIISKMEQQQMVRNVHILNKCTVQLFKGDISA